MARERTFKSVKELLKGIGISKDTAKSVEENIKKNTIAQELIARRTLANLTQKELADKMGVSEKVVARIEETPNEKQTMGNIKAYANALGYSVFLHFKEK